MDLDYLERAKKLPVRLYTAKEVCYMARISRATFYNKYANKIVYPLRLKSRRPHPKTYYCDQDIMIIFRDRFNIPPGKEKYIFAGLYGKKKRK